MGREQEIAELESRMEEIKARLKYLRRSSIVDTGRLRKIQNSAIIPNAEISMIARKAVTSRDNICTPVKVHEMTDKQYDAAKEFSDKIIDLFEETREKRAWE